MSRTPTVTSVAAMRSQLRRDLTIAMKTKDRDAVTALRSALAAIENAAAPAAQSANDTGGEHGAGAAIGVGTSEVQRHELTDTELRAVVEAEISERTVAAEEYDRLGRADHAGRLRAETNVLTRYLS